MIKATFNTALIERSAIIKFLIEVGHATRRVHIIYVNANGPPIYAGLQ